MSSTMISTMLGWATHAAAAEPAPDGKPDPEAPTATKADASPRPAVITLRRRIAMAPLDAAPALRSVVV